MQATRGGLSQESQVFSSPQFVQWIQRKYMTGDMPYVYIYTEYCGIYFMDYNFWLVVWNISYVPIYWESHHPN